jgi:AraC-like DNA-binding protein
MMPALSLSRCRGRPEARLLLAGRGWWRTTSRLEAGDCFLLTKGRRFILASDLELEPIDAEAVFAGAAAGGIAQHRSVVDFFAIGSRIVLDEVDAALLVDALPPAIHVSKFSEQADNMRWLLERLFKERIGASSLDYLLRWRKRLAGQALRQSSDPVSSIALSLGYASESAFSNAFKQVKGRSPLRCRWEVRSSKATPL